MKARSFREELADINTRYEAGEHLRELERLKSLTSERPFVIWGAGGTAACVLSYFYKHNIKIECFVDTYKTGVFEGHTIISPEELRTKYPNAVILPCAMNKRMANSIRAMLEKLGLSECCIDLTPHMCDIIGGLPSYKDITDHFDEYEWVYNVFEDDLSKRVLLDYIRMGLLNIPIKRTEADGSYFGSDVVQLSEEEVLIDGGCWVGDTVKDFIDRTKGRYKHIYSFEPNVVMCEKARQNLSSYNNIDLIPKGLWNTETELSFSVQGETGNSSFVFGEGTVTIPVTSLDKFFEDKPDSELPTFIEMDIEGAEKEALLGAKRIIREKNPTLAICAYHKPGDIYELTRLIQEFNPNYKFALRQLLELWGDTVLYAI